MDVLDNILQSALSKPITPSDMAFWDLPIPTHELAPIPEPKKPAFPSDEEIQAIIDSQLESMGVSEEMFDHLQSLEIVQVWPRKGEVNYMIGQTVFLTVYQDGEVHAPELTPGTIRYLLPERDFIDGFYV